MQDLAVDQVFAAADIGTNSVHMVIARIGAGGRIEILGREKEMVRLGRSSGDMKVLEADAMERGVAALKRCRELADAHGATLTAVATSAVREAENRADFLAKAYDDAGVTVEIVSGFEEARLIHLGVLQALPLFDRQLLLCDIGGGSTELLVGAQATVLGSRSLKLGAIRLTERFFGEGALREDGTASPKRLLQARQYTQTLLEPFATEIRRLGFDIFVGSSGTAETVVAMALAGRGDAPARTYNAAEITAAEIGAVVELLATTPVVDRAALPGVDPRRADILLAGALILEQVVESLAIETMVFSDYALREGVLLDAASRRSGGAMHHLQDLRRQSVLGVVDLFDDDPDHSIHASTLALQLFDEIAPLHGLGDDARELLEAGALLSNVGVSISHSGHHKHSYYVIRNSEHLTGFTDREIELIAQVARYHRKSPPRGKHAEFAALRRPDRAMVRTLAGILRIAIGLDRAHSGRVRTVRATWDDDTVTLRVVPDNGHDVDLECHAAETRRELFEQVLGRSVEFVVDPSDSGAEQLVGGGGVGES